MSNDQTVEVIVRNIHGRNEFVLDCKYSDTIENLWMLITERIGHNRQTYFLVFSAIINRNKISRKAVPFDIDMLFKPFFVGESFFVGSGPKCVKAMFLNHPKTYVVINFHGKEKLSDVCKQIGNLVEKKCDKTLYGDRYVRRIIRVRIGALHVLDFYDGRLDPITSKLKENAITMEYLQVINEPWKISFFFEISNSTIGDYREVYGFGSLPHTPNLRINRTIFAICRNNEYVFSGVNPFMDSRYDKNDLKPKLIEKSFSLNPGISIEGTCQNSSCKNHISQEKIIFQRKYTVLKSVADNDNRKKSFDLEYDMHECKCPKCSCVFLPERFRFWNCSWKYYGIKKNGIKYTRESGKWKDSFGKIDVVEFSEIGIENFMRYQFHYRFSNPENVCIFCDYSVDLEECSQGCGGWYHYTCFEKWGRCTNCLKKDLLPLKYVDCDEQERIEFAKEKYMFSFETRFLGNSVKCSKIFLIEDL